ncbi:MAG: M28 family metallopeptidase [Bacillota bacterium]|jgi:hypothetical protein
MTPWEILTKIAIPRPNGSKAVDATADFIADYCTQAGLTVTEEHFLLRTAMQPLVGLFILLCALAFIFFLWKRRPVWALIFALLAPVIYFAEFEYNLPTVSLLSAAEGRNIVVEAGPQDARQEIIIGAHYDSKTDLFDHEAREFFHNFGAISLGLIILIAIAALVLQKPFASSNTLLLILLIPAIIGVLGATGLALSMGGGFLRSDKSPGARDDGTAVAIMMTLAEDLANDPALSENWRVKLIFFGGEEVNMQGSAAYVAEHRSELLAANAKLINLECLAGQGPLRHHSGSGTFLRHYSSDARLISLVEQVAEELRQPVEPAGFMYDDSAAFLKAGIPAVSLSHSLPGHPDSYHNGKDSIDKVMPGKMEETVTLLKELITEIGWQGAN